MEWDKKLDAFTITEIIIVMVITTIVASLGFSVLRVVHRNLSGITENYEKTTSIQQLEQSLAIDFNKYSEIKWDQQNESILFSSPIGTKAYTFFKDSIVNSDNTRYNLLTNNKQFYFQGDELNNGGTIDAIKLSFTKNSNTQRIFVFKYNDITIHFQ